MAMRIKSGRCLRARSSASIPLRVPSVIAVRFQQIVKELHIELVVFDDQDGLRHPGFLRLASGDGVSPAFVGHIPAGSAIPLKFARASPGSHMILGDNASRCVRAWMTRRTAWTRRARYRPFLTE